MIRENNKTIYELFRNVGSDYVFGEYLRPHGV